ncbi:hypothetical protein QR680_009975 [Steinernema hermaphroditum]|uniref:Uncharacterized protein n=1 Tax=Steinernema hermaphroditum TaxID=289476 RepID=A0AA39INJ0_9BILA|nr:hypothetical protein QR680_009975 [Steinernema hermaphroditum]
MHTTFELVTGMGSILSAAVLPPAYIRIIYMGIVQLLTVPGTFMTGYKSVTGTDPFSIGVLSIKLYGVSFKVESLLSLVLALNRLRIICGLRYPTLVHDIIIFCSYLYGCAIMTLMVSSCIEYDLPVGEYLPKYNISIPYTQRYSFTTTIIQLVSTGLTFTIYMIILSYLIWLKSKTERIKKFEKEQTILIYAGVRFAADMTLIVVYNYIKVPVIFWIEMCVMFTYFVNNLLLPPLLYLTLYKGIRQEFFACGAKLGLHCKISRSSETGILSGGSNRERIYQATKAGSNDHTGVSL